MNNSLGAILNSLRREAGFTQPQVAGFLTERGLDIKTAGISKWEKDMTTPNALQFLALCEIYGVSDVMGVFTGAPGRLAGLNAEGRRLVDDYIRVLIASGLYAEPVESKGRILPLFTLAASAGTGQFLDDDNSEPIDAAGAPETADFAVRIAGDSMEPEISDGQIVWVRRRETLPEGRIGIFIYNGQAFCKRLRGIAGRLCLVSANPAYAPIEVEPSALLLVCGEVVS